MTELTKEKIEELKAANTGQLHELSGEDDDGNEYAMVSKSPTRPEWDRFQADILDDDRRHLGMRNLVTGCVVWPDKKELKEMLNEHPGLIQSFGKQIVTLSKARMEVTAKKL